MEPLSSQDRPLPGAAGWASWIESRGVAETLAGALAFLVYIPTLGFPFIYDDTPQVVQNPAIRAWRFLPRYFTAHAWSELYPNVLGNYYRPLFLIWFRLNHALFGLNPRGWHFTTVLCHVAATCLVLSLVRRLTGSRGMAFGAAVLFALHPVHLESVAWVSGVTDPLLAPFFLGSFLAYLRYREERRAGWMGGALGLFALGLLEKETMVVLGPLVFAYAWLYADDRPGIARLRAALQPSLGFFALTAVYLVVRGRALHGLSHAVTPLAASTVALTVPSIVWLYLRHFLWPFGLSGLYGLPYVERATSAGFAVPMLLLLALAVLVAWGISRLPDRRLALFACAWIALPIIPTLFLRAYAEGDIAHDRYLYIPSIGFVLLVGLFLEEIARRWPGVGRRLAPGAVVALALAYAGGTASQQIYWASDVLLESRAYQIAPQDNLITNNLGAALTAVGEFDRAIALYSQVLAREPGFWLSNYNLGYTYYRLGRFPHAEVFLRRAISINAVEDSDEYLYLGLSLWRQGRTEEAVPYVQRAIRIRPSAPGYHFALAMIRLEQHDAAAAESELKQELKYYPENTIARQQLRAITSSPSPAPK